MPEGYCETCRFWEKDGDYASGVCKRFPRVLEECLWVYPIQEDDDWCGEWKAEK